MSEQAISGSVSESSSTTGASPTRSSASPTAVAVDDQGRIRPDALREALAAGSSSAGSSRGMIAERVGKYRPRVPNFRELAAAA